MSKKNKALIIVLDFKTYYKVIAIKTIGTVIKIGTLTNWPIPEDRDLRKEFKYLWSMHILERCE
jgi:hypothetical protein